MPPEALQLPEPPGSGSQSVQQALWERRSTREFASKAMGLDQVAAILFAAQGVNRDQGYRTAPSAGALYPLELFLAAGEVDALAPGAWRYVPYTHSLTPSSEGDPRQALARACLDQGWTAEAQCLVVITAVYERVTKKYGERGVRYCHIEAGCASENMALVLPSLGLGSTVVGAFRGRDVQKAVGASDDEEPLVVQPVGRLRI